MARAPCWQRAALLLTVVLALAGTSQALFVIEKGALKIKFPRKAAQAHRDGFDVSMANFGSPKYGGELMCGPWAALLGRCGFFSKVVHLTTISPMSCLVSEASWSIRTRNTGT